jgi:hypothetical protein
MPIFRAKQYAPSYADIAWWLIPLGVAIALTIILFGRMGASDQKMVMVTETSADTELLLLGGLAVEPVNGADFYADFIPPNDLLKQRVLHNLQRFQADFRQLAPAMHVQVSARSISSEHVARELAAMLSSAGLWNASGARDSSPELPQDASPALVVYCLKQDREVVHRLMAAVAPYIRGNILLVFTSINSLHNLRMVIGGTATFKPNGTAIFAGATAQAGDGT